MSSLARSHSQVLGEIRKELYDDHEFRQVAHVFVIMGASVSHCDICTGDQQPLVLEVNLSD